MRERNLKIVLLYFLLFSKLFFTVIFFWTKTIIGKDKKLFYTFVQKVFIVFFYLVVFKTTDLIELAINT